MSHRPSRRAIAEERIIRLYDERRGILRRAENVPVASMDI
jgi:hypothetical protein